MNLSCVFPQSQSVQRTGIFFNQSSNLQCKQIFRRKLITNQCVRVYRNLWSMRLCNNLTSNKIRSHKYIIPQMDERIIISAVTKSAVWSSLWMNRLSLEHWQFIYFGIIKWISFTDSTSVFVQPSATHCSVTCVHTWNKTPNVKAWRSYLCVYNWRGGKTPVV